MRDSRATHLHRRPGERRDPYAAAHRIEDAVVTFCNNWHRWLWVPAFAGTTMESVGAFKKSMKMMDRSVAVTDIETIGRRNRGVDPGLGNANRGFHVVTLGKARREGG